MADSADDGRQIETATSVIRLGDDGIVRVKNAAGAVIDLEVARRDTNAARELIRGDRAPMLIDIREIQRVTRAARTYLAGEEMAQFSSAQAVLVDWSISRAIGSFFLDVSQPVMPSRIFTSERKAMTWLKGFL